MSIGVSSGFLSFVWLSLLQGKEASFGASLLMGDFEELSDFSTSFPPEKYNYLPPQIETESSSSSWLNWIREILKRITWGNKESCCGDCSPSLIFCNALEFPRVFRKCFCDIQGADFLWKGKRFNLIRVLGDPKLTSSVGGCQSK